jgi:dihydrofolate reductase
VDSVVAPVASPAFVGRTDNRVSYSEGTEADVARLIVSGISMSVDGYVAGPRQDQEHPLGVGGERLHQWIYGTRTFHRMTGEEGGSTGVDDDIFARAHDDIGATIMGRNMFGPVRGPWGPDDWRGWWGPEPPFHHPVFVLTHHARANLEMDGGTTFHFVTDGVESALRQATDAAAGRDVSLPGGADSIRQFLRADLIDELGVVIVPVLLGEGERLLEGVRPSSEFTLTSWVTSPSVVHARFTRSGPRRSG